MASSVDGVVWCREGGDLRYRPSISLDRDDVSHGIPYAGDGVTPGPHNRDLRGLVGNGCETGLLLSIFAPRCICSALFASQLLAVSSTILV